MADLNPFDLLCDDDNDDPSKLIAIHQQKVDPAKKASAPAAKKQPAKLPTKPPPPTQAGELKLSFFCFFLVSVFMDTTRSYYVLDVCI